MTQTSAPPPADSTARRRRVVPWLSSRPDTRAIQIGVLGTVLIHLLLILLVPRLFKGEPPRTGVRSRMPQFNIQILPESFNRKPVPKPPMKFVEANRNANNKVPEKTNNFSDQNQQVAQEKPTPNGKNDHPALKGQTKIKSDQIVSGQLIKPQEEVPVTPPVPPKPAVVANRRQEQNPLPGIEKAQGPDKDAASSSLSKFADNAKAIPERIDGQKEASTSEADHQATPQIDRNHPRPRRTLEQPARPAIFTNNDFGTSNLGITALDARFSNYGVYLRRLIETIDTEWHGILNERRTASASGNYVVVKFKLNSKGEIAEFSSPEPTPGTPDADVQACVAGVRDRSPYGPWTPDMIATLGTEQELEITFYYE